MIGCTDMESYARGYNEGYADGAAHALWAATMTQDQMIAAVTAGRCTRTPQGWWCSLPEGHSGTCPAREFPRNQQVSGDQP